jgi:sodium/potassium-transporting ATPase subunit alpha
LKDQSGTAKGLVIRTGNRTVVGCIRKSISNPSISDTPIAKEISHSIYIITVVAVFLGIFFFIVAFSLGYAFIESVILLIFIIMVNAPKDLLITVKVNRDWRRRIRNEFHYSFRHV